jgi:MFS family permease
MHNINPLRIFWQLRSELKTIFSALLINRMGTMVLPFLTLYLVHQLHFSAAQAGFIFGLFGFGALITDVLWSWLLARFSLIKVMVVTPFISGATLLIFPLLHNFFFISLAALVFAMANEAFRPASLAIISSLSASEQRKIAFSINRLAINLGMSIGPAIGGFVATKSFLLLFVINGVSTLITGLVLWQKLLHKNISAEKTATQPPTQAIITSNAFHDKRLIYFLLAFIPVLMVFMQHESTLGLFIVHNLHATTFYYGLIFTINTVLIVLLEVSLNALTLHWSNKKSLLLGSALITLGFSLLIFTHSFLGVVIASIIWTFGEMFSFPAGATYISHIAPAEKQGNYMALYSGSFNLAIMLGPWAGLYIYDVLGSTTLWLACFIAGMISVVMLALMRKS